VIIIRFRDEATQKRALGFLIGRFSGHSWASGEVAVPEEALAPLAREGIPFAVEGPATHERILSLRDSAVREWSIGVLENWSGGAVGAGKRCKAEKLKC
jgi:hypothetical protein